MGSYMKELEKLRLDAAQLADDALNHRQTADQLDTELRRMEERIVDIELSLEAAPETYYDAIEAAVNDIERNMIFVREIIKAPNSDPLSEAQQINAEAYNLALAMLDGRSPPEECRSESERLSADLRELLAVKSESADVQRLLSEAALELHFVAQNGKASTSSRVAQYMRDRSAD
jgi:Mg2+ and Co2+ transporter CorA